MLILDTSQASVRRALKTLHQGGIVIHATETCYGITCDVCRPEVVARLFAIKRRPEAQPVSVLFGSVAQAENYLAFSETARRLAEKYLPGPLTLLLPRKENPVAALHVTHPGAAAPTVIGMRISSHPIAMALASGFPRPIATTSANLHGFPETYSLGAILSQFQEQEHLADMILDSGDLPVQLPSTIVEIEGGEMRVVRQGNIRVDAIR